MEQPRRRYTDKIFDALPGYLTVQNRDFEIIEANETFCQDFGDYQGRYCYQIYKHRPERCEDCPVARTFHDGQQHRSEEQVTTLDGRKVSVLVYTTPILDDNGEVSEVIEMSTDVTEMKVLQKDLRESRHKYRQLFEDVPCFISIQDKDLNITDANRMHRETFGTGYGRKCFELYKHRTTECMPCTVKKTFKDGLSHSHEEVVTSQTGEQINVLVHTAPVRTENGEVDSVIEMSTDITELRQLQDKLSSVGMLISTISHGIKGLLNGLDGGIYLINTGLKKQDKARLDKGWDITLRNVRRIRSMVMDILYYAKDREPNLDKISIDMLVTEVGRMMTDRAVKLGVEMSYEVDGECMCECDPQMIRSLLINLVENSLDACRIDSAKETHYLKLALKTLPEAVQITVEDNGIGMDRETREKAFSLFFSSKGAGGTGLGLFISNKIAQAHGGRIIVESEEGQGCRFLVELPKKQSDNAVRDEDVV